MLDALILEHAAQAISWTFRRRGGRGVTVPIQLVDKGSADGFWLLSSSCSANGRGLDPVRVTISFVTGGQVVIAMTSSRTVVVGMDDTRGGRGGRVVCARIHWVGSMRHGW